MPDIHATTDFAVFELFADIMLNRLAGNDKFVNRCLSDPEFRQTVFAGLAKELFETIRAGSPSEDAASR